MKVDFKVDFRESISMAREELKARVDGFRDYIESEQFERDLDHLASRLQLDRRAYNVSSAEDRPQRVRAKARYIFEHARKEILKSAEVGGAFALLSRRSRVVLAISMICGGIKGAEILFECYQVFVPAARRRGLHVV